MERAYKYELLDKYIDQELSDKERQELDALMTEDEEFKEEVEVAVMMNASFNVEQKQRWAKLLEAEATKTSVQPSQPTKTSETDTDQKETKVRQLQPRTRWLRIAAMLLPAVFALFLYLFLANSSQTAPQMADHYLSNRHQAPTITMSQGNDLSQNWKTAIKAYQEEKYESAANLLEPLTNSTNATAEQHFYLGLTYLYKEKAEPVKAIQQFEKSQQLNPAQYSAEGNWYIALAHLKNDDWTKAKPLLEQIVANKDWKWQTAKEILEEQE